MKERPILFSAPMVRAILDARKTQTRRVVKPSLVNNWDPPTGPEDIAAGYPFVETDEGHVSAVTLCPYGQPGDRLWVRETWARTHNVNAEKDWPGRQCKLLADDPGVAVIYAADGSWNWCDDDGFSTERSYWKPSIHMPRWACRITLEITGVRIERLNDISEADARAEGCIPDDEGLNPNNYGPAVDLYHELWNTINKAEPWATNPWVWVVEFKRVEA